MTAAVIEPFGGAKLACEAIVCVEFPVVQYSFYRVQHRSIDRGGSCFLISGRGFCCGDFDINSWSGRSCGVVLTWSCISMCVVVGRLGRHSRSGIEAAGEFVLALASFVVVGGSLAAACDLPWLGS